MGPCQRLWRNRETLHKFDNRSAYSKKEGVSKAGKLIGSRRAGTCKNHAESCRGSCYNLETYGYVWRLYALEFEKICKLGKLAYS